MRFLTILIAAFVAFPANSLASQPLLTDQRGAHFTMADLRGSALVVTFISARCKDVCPLIDAQIATAAHDPRAQARNIRFLTVTLDPEHDSRTDMARIAREFHADPSRWILASGNPRDVHAIMREFGVAGNPKMHTTFVYIVGANGRDRVEFLASTGLVEQIFGAVR